MKHSSLYVALLLCQLVGCKDEWHRHLVCADGDGKVLVDTRDLKSAAKQYETAWDWTLTNGSYHALSIPPHSCVYESHPVPERGGCGCPLDPARGPEGRSLAANDDVLGRPEEPVNP